MLTAGCGREKGAVMTEDMLLRDENGRTEEEFLSQYSSDGYPKPSLTADILIFRKTGEDIHLLMIRRKGHPFMGCLALPGGFAEPGETIESSAARELQEETGLTGQELKLTGIYSAPGRDPRGWTVSAAFATLVEGDVLRPAAADDAASIHWMPVEKGEDGCWKPLTQERLAFDHSDIIKDAARAILG